MGPDPVKDIIWEGFEGRYGTDDERGRMPTLPPLYYGEIYSAIRFGKYLARTHVRCNQIASTYN